MSFYRNTTTSGNNTAPVDRTDSGSFPMDQTDTDTVSVDEADIDLMEGMESMVLSEDTYPLDYLAATDTCLAFGVFFLAGLLLARMAWGHLK